MKNIHIVGVIMLLIASFLFFSTSKDMSTYGGFADAQSERVIKVVGQLEKDKPMIYNPLEDPNNFTFHMKDQDGISKKVVLNQPKPTDFEQSEQIVLTGKLEEGTFYASDILLKCPSKYKDEEIQLRKKV